MRATDWKHFKHPVKHGIDESWSFRGFARCLSLSGWRTTFSTLSACSKLIDFVHQCMKTSCKQCFMAMQLQEVFLTSIWPRHKVQWVALNLSFQRKSFTEWCALSRTVEAAKKIDHDLVNREFSNKVVKKWLWETLRLTFVSNICHYILYSAL